MFDPRMWREIRKVWFGPPVAGTTPDQRFWLCIWSIVYTLMLLPWTVVMLPYLIFTFLTWVSKHITDALCVVVDVLMDAVHPCRFGPLRKYCHTKED